MTRETIFSIFIFALIIVGFAWAASPSDFYQWTDAGGTVNYTDNAKKIPTAYKTKAVERSFADLDATKTTPHNTSGDMAGLGVRLEGLREANATSPAPTSDCAGHVTVTKERRSVTPPSTGWTGTNDYNRTFIVTRDECGNVISVTRFNSRININR